MPNQFCVRLTKDYLVFSAAHFITFAGNICERLHGHNYRVEAEVHGPLDENQYVVDFIALRDTLRRQVEWLDHHVLLPTTHPQIVVVQEGSEVIARFESRRWVFPADDCRLLPLPNTTAELLAEYLARELAASSVIRDLPTRPRLRVAVDECQGQWGICELAADAWPA